MESRDFPANVHNRLRERALAIQAVHRPRQGRFLNAFVNTYHGIYEAVAIRDDPQPRQSHFLNLPVEIRLEIYELVLKNASSAPHRLAILRVSRQIHLECFTTSMKYVTLQFASFKKLLRFYRELNPDLRKHVKRVQTFARSPEELYEIPGAIQACCGGLHLTELILQPRKTDDKWGAARWYLNVARKMGLYLKDVGNIDTITIRSNEVVFENIRFLFNELYMLFEHGKVPERVRWRYWAGIGGGRIHPWVSGLTRCRDEKSRKEFSKLLCVHVTGNYAKTKLALFFDSFTSRILCERKRNSVDSLLVTDGSGNE